MSTILEDPRYSTKTGVYIFILGIIVGTTSDILDAVISAYRASRFEGTARSLRIFENIQLLSQVFSLVAYIIEISITVALIYLLFTKFLPEFQSIYSSLLQILPFFYLVFSLGYFSSWMLRGFVINFNFQGAGYITYVLRSVFPNYGGLSSYYILSISISVLSVAITHSLVFVLLHQYGDRYSDQSSLYPENEKPAK